MKLISSVPVSIVWSAGEMSTRPLTGFGRAEKRFTAALFGSSFANLTRSSDRSIVSLIVTRRAHSGFDVRAPISFKHFERSASLSSAEHKKRVKLSLLGLK